MELHNGKPADAAEFEVPWSSDIDTVFGAAKRYAEAHHAPSMKFFREVRLQDLTAHRFWSEYVWGVYTSGFNARVVSKKIDALMTAYGPWSWTQPRVLVWRRVQPVFANRKKFDSIQDCRELIQSIGWDQFRDRYCQSPETLQRLPFVGKVTCFHLARNIGIDAVKPDLHLVRLASHYGYETPLELCNYLAQRSKERIGVVDFILWSYCAAFGTKGLE